MNKENLWGPWRTFDKCHHFSHVSLRETLQGGQSFDWKSLSDYHWRGKIGDVALECRWEKNLVQWRKLRIQTLKSPQVEKYFFLDQGYQNAIDELPWRSDPVLRKCISKLRGLRILRQPLDQTLFYFLLSSAKSIPQIQSIGDAVCKKYGKEIAPEIYSFPGWERLAQVSEAELRSLKLGYRAKYVAQTARLIANQDNGLEGIGDLPYRDAKKELLRLPGVGEKIADCVLLFGGNFLEAFPMDTWIEKSLEKRYALKGWKSDNKIHFARIHFGKSAGLAQQFLFSAERLGILDKK